MADSPNSDANPDIGSAPAALLSRAVETWVSQLVDLTGRNTLLYYKDQRVGTLDLGASGVANPQAISQLLIGRTVRLSTLFQDSETLSAAARRCRTITARARENFEERGLSTLMVGYGMATWRSDHGTATPAAPILLCQLSMLATGGSGDDFNLALSGDWEINPSLLHLLDAEFGVVIGPGNMMSLIDEGPTGFRGDVVTHELQAAARSVPGFDVLDRTVCGNFSYAKLPMVNDIKTALESGLLEESDLLAAIAGDREARSRLVQGQLSIDPRLPDTVPPANEYLVLDADSSQSYAINAAVAGADLVVNGPPGTGKSQTIANLIATFAAQGKSVLFVAEKRAAIDAVLDRLNRVGLADVVQDLHDSSSSRRKLASDVAQALASQARIARPDLEAQQTRLARDRAQLVAREHALHVQREPWAHGATEGYSIYQIQAELLGLPDAGKFLTPLEGIALRSLERTTYRHAADALQDFIALNGLSLERGDASPWSAALTHETIATADQAREALSAVRLISERTLPSAHAQLLSVLDQCGLGAPIALAGWTEVLSLLDEVAATLELVDPGIYEEDLDGLATALRGSTGSVPRRAAFLITSARYRKARNTVRTLWRNSKPAPGEALALVQSARSQLARWKEHQTDGGLPRLPKNLLQTEGAYAQLGLELRSVGAWLGSALDEAPATAVQEEMLQLAADEDILYRLPTLTELRRSLHRFGLGHVLTEVARRNVTSEIAVAALRGAWLSGVLREVSLSDPLIGAFDGENHRRMARAYVAEDTEHIASGALRVQRAIAERAMAQREQHQEQASIIQNQANRRRGLMPIRQLFELAPHVLTAIRPCWAMSPLVVAQLLPAKKCFDVVIFDEASQVLPADSVGAIMRSRQAIVAGDPKQLPPTTFFAGSVDDGDEENVLALTSGFESILDVMTALLPPPYGTRTLSWHYRSQDERLIAFSNAQPSLYNWTLTTFPGVSGPDCLNHELAEWSPGRPAEEESSSEEVRKVVDIIINHFETRPTESLGIITMGVKHSDRITEQLRLERANDPELDRWLEHGPSGRSSEEPTFVKNLERVQGDERDAIVLSIGYTKSADGRMQYTFGPLTQAGGERRLNVAITRARKRMTLVSSFSHADLDPSRLRSEGMKMIGRYLAYAESNGSDLGPTLRDRVPLNPFEVNVRDRLNAAGIPLIAQYGSSGYWIDFAARHPERTGQMVLAIECDGASYHSLPTARDRDRLRQEHLERLGWRFHRIWSTDWFRDPDQQVALALSEYKRAVQAEDHIANNPVIRPQTGLTTAHAITFDERASELPPIRIIPGQPIIDYSKAQLVKLVDWIESDSLLRTEQEVLALAVELLGYRRRGARITETLTAAIRQSRARRSRHG